MAVFVLNSAAGVGEYGLFRVRVEYEYLAELRMGRPMGKDGPTFFSNLF